ncbi:ABC transporter ATP-binding protein [Novosphingobium guangzhouense]|uniref:Dipeptide ABC transporter ATP-binding protein DppD n=1 Tax=Novosphingobium guangzhouense TaxID=1850347 RepID=A0A2K2G3F6_9SPHN|nr:ABC transporter ATP-binding protein [Novosphingobium guangzhouense]PNU05528.1 dipeptide ABC transporter ATP-binding protein DppD [Novosphingobium guangzhouense]
MSEHFILPRGDGPSLLAVDDLRVAFGEKQPVKGISFEINEGETLAIVGESGSGKSLTALSIMGLLPAGGTIAHGSIQFEGREITTLAPREARALRGGSIGMIFQEPMTCLNPVMTIGAQIIEALRQHQSLSRKAARARALELLDLVRIPDPHRRIDDFPYQLSGGMRQRVMIAVAVACSPRLLIADEPTTALDVTIQAQVLDLIDRLRRELSMAVLLITHDLGVVSQWADRVVVMYAGRKVEQARPDAMFGNPLHPYTRGLLNASPRLGDSYNYIDGPLYEIPGSISSLAGDRGCAFAPRCAHVRAGCRDAVPALATLSHGRQVACPVLLSEENRVTAVDL